MSKYQMPALAAPTGASQGAAIMALEPVQSEAQEHLKNMLAFEWSGYRHGFNDCKLAAARIASRAPPAAMPTKATLGDVWASGGVHWDLFPGYLIDHEEGGRITEEGLQFALASMLKDADYLRMVGERAAMPAQASEPAMCPACHGCGESSVLDGGGPDAQEIPCNCPHCNGTGALEDAYRGVVALLAAENKKYMDACAKLYFSPPAPAPAIQAQPLTDAARLDWLDSEDFVALNCYIGVYNESGQPLEPERKFYVIERESDGMTVEGTTAREAIDVARGAGATPAGEKA